MGIICCFPVTSSLAFLTINPDFVFKFLESHFYKFSLNRCNVESNQLKKEFCATKLFKICRNVIGEKCLQGNQNSVYKRKGRVTGFIAFLFILSTFGSNMEISGDFTVRLMSLTVNKVVVVLSSLLHLG